jgi:hypothetical protein
MHEQERELCASVRLLPAHYLALKGALMRESTRRGHLPRSEARTMFRRGRRSLLLHASNNALPRPARLCRV